MTTFYVIIKYFTIIGTFTKAFFEHLSCRIYEVLVEDGRYLTPTEMCGHIEHEFIKTRSTCFGICFFPFMFNLIIGLVFTSVGSLDIIHLGEFYTNSGHLNILSFVFLWIGISFLTNLFPQMEDALTLKELIYNNETSKVIKVIAAPIFAILYYGAKLEKTGLSIFTSIIFAFILPSIFGLFLPAVII